MSELVEITSREFRSNQRTFFERADKGEKILIRRKNKSYILTPVEEGDVKTVLSTELLQRIEDARLEKQRGELLTISEGESLTDFFNRID